MKSPTRPLARRVGAWSLIASMIVASPIAAQPSTQDKVGAEALFDQAKRLVAEGKYAEACTKFEQSQRLDPGIGTLLYLADCYEKSGRLASAWVTFREGASQARAAGQQERATAGDKRASALEPKLSRLTINVAKQSFDVTIVRGEAKVQKDLWGVPVPVDGGRYQITATAPGARSWSKAVEVKNEKDNASIDVPALEADPNASAAPPEQAPAPPVVTPAPVAPSPPPPTQDSSSSGSSQRTIGLVLGGVGIVGVAIGSFFGLRAISKNSDAKEVCEGSVCREERGVELTDDAQKAAVISNIAYGVGLAALAGGVLLYVTAPNETRSGERTSRTRLSRPALGVGAFSTQRGGGISLGGQF